VRHVSSGSSFVRVAIMAIGLLALSGCKKGEKKEGGGEPAGKEGGDTAAGGEKKEGGEAQQPAGGGAGRIALLLPESQTARYEAADRPFFEAKFKELCSGVEIVYSNANQVATDQQQQAEAAIAQGVKVLVLDPVDGEAAGGIANDAKAKNIPVISYDRLIKGGASPDYYVSFDNERVGQLQGQALLEKLTAMGKKEPKITMINGSPTDNNATLFKAGAHKAMDGKVKVAKEDAAANWKPEEAQQLMEQFIAAVGPKGFDGAYQANDGTAGGAIAAMKAAGIDPKSKPTTGQDAELAAIQRIVAGEQYMTVYKAIRPEAEKTAELACALYKGEKPAEGVVTGKVNNGTIDVPSVLLTPIAVTVDGAGETESVADTVVKDKFYGEDSVAQICKGYEKACAAAKIQ
jgi:D-xylose transport system substrate-binding protein